LTRALIKDGFGVVTAASGAEGLRLAREMGPAAITLDVLMPEMDGWTVLATLKADPELAEVPVVLVTILDAHEKGLTLGAADYLPKPIDRDRLVERIRRLVTPAATGRVLLVEDEEVTRAVMRQGLERGGFEVAEAENGRLALARLAEDIPDIIVLDLMMPEMDGFDFLVELRRRPEWREVPVLVVTARTLTADDRRRLSGGVERVIEKGAGTIADLLREVGRVLARAVARRQSGTAAGAGP
jgi:CheY-like chemotaxis protein